MARDRVQSLHVRTLTPLSIGLEEYDVRPREAFGKLAQKTLDALGGKVAKSAPVTVEFTHVPQVTGSSQGPAAGNVRRS